MKCYLTDQIVEVWNQMSTHRVHRVYIVDKTEKPIGVICICDILDFLVGQ